MANARWQKIYEMPFAKIYPMYVTKAEKKGRTKEEVNQIIKWMFGYTPAALKKLIDKESDVATFITKAPKLNPDRELITGTVCGVRVEEVEEPMMRELRYLDKLIDELARGRKMDKILRKPA